MSRFGWSPEGKVDVESLLESLEIEKIRQSGHDEWVFACPFEAGHAHGDKNPSAGMNGETTAWQCWGCKKKGNAITLASSLLGCSPSVAKRLIREAYDPSSLDVDLRVMRTELKIAFDSIRKEKKKVTNEPISEEFVEVFATDWSAVEQAIIDGNDYVPEMLEYPIVTRWFEPETLEEWEFGYDEKSGRITFAIRDMYGKLVGFKARGSSDHKPKYLYLGDASSELENNSGRYGFPRCSKGLLVFGADRAEPGEHWVVVEGEFNAIALWQMGHKNVVAVNGSFVSDTQIKILSNASKLTFWFDDDPAGNNGLWGYDDEHGHHEGVLERLAPSVDLCVAYGDNGKDAADYLADGDQETPREILHKSESYTKLLIRRKMAARQK